MNSDGTLSSSEIDDFTQTVLTSNDTMNLSDLTKVIPVEYLRTTGEEKYYAYNGLEYGFYVRHRAVSPMNIFGGIPGDPVYVLDILLIDFTYEPTAEAKEFKIRLDPLFSETFLYANEDGTEKWTRITGAYNLGSVHGSPDIYQDYRAKLWIENPKFATYLLNENSQNVGDTSYNSIEDTGLIIEQSRINYSGYREVVVNNPESLIETGVNVFFGIENMVAGTVLPVSLSNLLTLIDLTKALSLAAAESFTTKLENVECNNEVNIISAMGDYQTDPYSARAMLVEPYDVLAFKAGESYAENIIRVDRIDSRTRITQVCTFDIVSSLDLDAVSGQTLNEVDEEGNSIPFAFGRQGVYYDEAGVSTIPSNNFNVVVPYYLLSNGNQQYVFNPFATGNYTVISEKPVSVYYNGEKLNTNDYNFSVDLIEGVDYTFVVESEQAIESSFSITFSPPTIALGSSTVAFNNETYKFYSLNGVYENYRIETGDTELYIKIYNSNQELLQNTLQNSQFYSNNEIKYVEFVYASAKTQTINVVCNREKEIVFVSSDVTVPSQTAINGVFVSLPTPIREGFIFDGWYLNSTYTGNAITAERVMQVQAPTVTLYAKWTIDNDYTFSITYTPLMADGSDVDDLYINWTNKDEDYTTEESVTFPTLESLKYELVGWYYDADFTQECTTWTLSAGSYGNKTFYAKLTLKEYTVSFVTNSTAVCSDITATYQQTITLPDITRTGYIGTWGEWGAKKANGEYPTNFGGSYVVEGNVTLVAQWKEVYEINYENIDYGGFKGVTYYDGVLYGPSYYVVGEGVNLNRITAKITRPAYYTSSTFVHLGWYTDMEFTTKVTSISTSQTGAVTIYAKWQYNYFGYLFEAETTVTDSSEMTQDCVYLLISQDELDNLLSIGIKQLTIGLYINMWEVNDGYQEILIYGDEEGEVLLWSDTSIEHGSGKKLTTAEVHFFDVRIDIQTLKDNNVTWMYVRFGANGNGDDDWKYDVVFFELYFTAKDATVTRDSSFADKNPLD